MAIVNEETGEITEDEDAPITEEQIEEAEQEDAPEPDESQPTEPEQEPEPAAVDEKAMEKALKLLDKEAAAHAKRVETIMGADFADLQVCPLCAPNIPGFRFPLPPAAPVIAMVKDAIGEPASPDYLPDGFSRVCDACGGLGATNTGSKVSGQGTVQCIPCAGKGWVAVGPERALGQVLTNGAPPPPVNYGADAPDPALPPEAQALKDLGYIVVAPIPQTV
jgi:hypothetical protein